MSLDSDLAAFAVEYAMLKGADEAQCDISSSSHVSITRRDGRVEEASQADSRGLSLSVMVDGKFAQCSSSDLRPDALRAFITKAVESATFLEPDLNRVLATLEEAETNRATEILDQYDPSQKELSADKRAEYVTNLEHATRALDQADVISGSVFYGDGSRRWTRENSNGFKSMEESTWFSVGGDLSLQDGGKIPEGYAHYVTLHQEDLPPIVNVAQAIHDNTRAALGASARPSGRYPMLLRSDVVRRILGMFLSPLSGGALHRKQSCFLDALGTQVGSGQFTLLSDPTLQRGFGSNIWDKDNRASYPRTLVNKGILQQYNIGLYNSRRLGVDPTGHASNLVIAPGSRTEEEILQDLNQCIMVTGFLGGNSNATSGDFSLGIRGIYYEKGEAVQAVSEMNVSGNLTQVFRSLAEVARDPWMYGSVRSPSLLFEDITFSGN